MCEVAMGNVLQMYFFTQGVSITCMGSGLLDGTGYGFLMHSQDLYT